MNVFTAISTGFGIVSLGGSVAVMAKPLLAKEALARATIVTAIALLVIGVVCLVLAYLSSRAASQGQGRLTSAGPQTLSGNTASATQPQTSDTGGVTPPALTGLGDGAAASQGDSSSSRTRRSSISRVSEASSASGSSVAGEPLAAPPALSAAAAVAAASATDQQSAGSPHGNAGSSPTGGAAGVSGAASTAGDSDVPFAPPEAPTDLLAPATPAIDRAAAAAKATVLEEARKKRAAERATERAKRDADAALKAGLTKNRAYVSSLTRADAQVLASQLRGHSAAAAEPSVNAAPQQQQPATTSSLKGKKPGMTGLPRISIPAHVLARNAAKKKDDDSPASGTPISDGTPPPAPPRSQDV